jgi:hypothetical protein
MCYSAEVSAGTFLFVSAICAYLWKRGKGLDRPIAGILFTVVLMQALEWILWNNLSCNWINKLVSRLIHIYLVLQPVVINFLVWFYDAGWGSGYKELGLLSLLFVPIVAWRTGYLQTKCAALGPKGNLQWAGVPNDAWDSRLMRAFYYPALFYPILTLKNTTFAALYGLFGIGSLFVYGETSEKSWPSLWCHFVNSLALFAVFRGAP